MKTMTRIENVEPLPSGNIVVTVLGGEKVGTTDKALGEDAMLAFHDKGHDMWEVEYEQRNGKLFLTGFEPIIAPPELGGPSDGDAESAPATSPPDLSLDDLVTLDARIKRIEEFLEATTEFSRE